MMRAIYIIKARSAGHIGRVGYARDSTRQVVQSIITNQTIINNNHIIILIIIHIIIITNIIMIIIII